MTETDRDKKPLPRNKSGGWKKKKNWGENWEESCKKIILAAGWLGDSGRSRTKAVKEERRRLSARNERDGE